MPEGHLQARHFDLCSAAGESACLPPTMMTGLSCRGRSRDCRAGHRWPRPRSWTLCRTWRWHELMW